MRVKEAKLSIELMKRMILLIAHFPFLYPDELLYSGIARYHQMSGNTVQKQTIKELFGDSLVCATVDLPSHLKHLSEILNSLYTVDELIMKHTLYPYYKAFIPQVKARMVYELMSEGSSQGEVHVLLGIPASLIKLPSYLRYCIICYEEDLSTYNEPYWHRSHQVPGVCVCPVHKMALRESKVTYSTREEKFKFILIKRSEKDASVIDIHAQLDHLNQYIMVAERSNELLRSIKVVTDCSSISKRDLDEKGYLTKQGRIRFLKLIQDFNAYFSQEFLELLQCKVDEDKCDTWLHKMIRGNDLMFHPLRHILVTEFLGLKNLDSGESTGNEIVKLNKEKLKNYPDRRGAKLSRTPYQDWEKRDLLILSEVEKIVMKLKSQKIKPQRVSLAMVSKSLNKSKVPLVLEKCLYKLPKTKGYLDEEFETTEQFQIRRLECAADRMVNEGFKVQGWRLLKAAGLNRPLRKSVEEKFNNLAFS
jgi:hypothetical protein